MRHYDNTTIESVSYSNFIPFLQSFYTREVVVPPRPHYHLPSSGGEAVLLVMPAWQMQGFVGVKVINVFPDNAQRDLPTIQGIYLLMDAENGRMLATYDGPSLTTIRTAAVSALAAKLVTRLGIQKMLMLGTGKLCHELIKAHCAVRPINKVIIWGRNFEKAKMRAESIHLEGVDISATEHRELVMSSVDLISAATYTKDPIINGEYISKGIHLDLVGSYTPDRREADDDCYRGSSLFVDDYNAIKECGDLAIPIESGVIKESDIIADLKQLSAEGYRRLSSLETTVFKSVGNAKSDLALAVYLHQKSDS